MSYGQRPPYTPPSQRGGFHGAPNRGPYSGGPGGPSPFQQRGGDFNRGGGRGSGPDGPSYGGRGGPDGPPYGGRGDGYGFRGRPHFDGPPGGHHEGGRGGWRGRGGFHGPGRGSPGGFRPGFSPYRGPPRGHFESPHRNADRGVDGGPGPMRGPAFSPGMRGPPGGPMRGSPAGFRPGPGRPGPFGPTPHSPNPAPHFGGNAQSPSAGRPPPTTPGAGPDGQRKEAHDPVEKQLAASVEERHRLTIQVEKAAEEIWQSRKRLYKADIALERANTKLRIAQAGCD